MFIVHVQPCGLDERNIIPWLSCRTITRAGCSPEHSHPSSLRAPHGHSSVAICLNISRVSETPRPPIRKIGRRQTNAEEGWKMGHIGRGIRELSIIPTSQSPLGFRLWLSFYRQIPRVLKTLRPPTGQHYTSTKDQIQYLYKGRSARRRHLILCWKTAPRTMQDDTSYYARRRHLVLC